MYSQSSVWHPTSTKHTVLITQSKGQWISWRFSCLGMLLNFVNGFERRWIYYIKVALGPPVSSSIVSIAILRCPGRPQMSIQSWNIQYMTLSFLTNIWRSTGKLHCTWIRTLGTSVQATIYQMTTMIRRGDLYHNNIFIWSHCNKKSTTCCDKKILCLSCLVLKMADLNIFAAVTPERT